MPATRQAASSIRSPRAVPAPGSLAATPATGESPRSPHVAYLASRFPKLTETFVLYEALAVEDSGVPVEVYALQRESATRLHPEAEALLSRAHFAPLVSVRIARAHLHFLRHRPRAYLSALLTLIRANLGSARYLAGALAFFPKTVLFARDMAERGVTHVHAHFASHPAAAAWVIRRLTDIPYSFTAHGSDLHRDRHMLREKVAAAEFVVAISRYNRDLIVEECGPEAADRVVVIHCGVDSEVFRKRAKPLVNEGPVQLLCTGTLHEVKGQTHLIEACRLLSERGVDFVCHLVGDGPDRARLERQAERAGLAARIRFHGTCTRDEVALHLVRADVVVVPSVPTRCGRREGIPVVLMEAGASGKPVVASRLSGIPEAVDHGVEGLLVAPGDTAGLADAIARLAADAPLRQHLGAAARRRVLAEFDLRSNAQQLAERFAGGQRP